MSLRYINPITITDAMLASSNGLETPPTTWSSGTTYADGDMASTGTAGGIITVWESIQSGNTNHDPTTDDGTWWTKLGTTYAAWNSGTTYAADAIVLLASTHRIYKSVQASNTNHDPATDLINTWWLDIGPTNRWAMFDQTVGTISTRAGSISISLDLGIISSLALLDVSATSVVVTMDDAPGGTEVYSATIDMSDTAELLDWYMYFFDPITPRSSVLIDDLPPYSAGRLTVTINSATTAACGTLAVGEQIEVGPVRYGVRVGIIDYSRKETDEWGITRVVERSYAKRVEAEIHLRNSQVDYLSSKLAAVRAVPCVWFFDDEFTSIQLYGWLKDWGINIAYPLHSEMTLTVEGLT